ncbi:hypothetical protein D4764_07G0010290 [Takifugu flavidus]|uniref:Cystatin domain-containing protein n=1 Tax=Takifugu flavidus TaxID=433684 RepID=A0A5C6MY19_9TELE|nr:hypothetical protein D4764_07G0010290 [Takifugu flavidus]
MTGGRGQEDRGQQDRGQTTGGQKTENRRIADRRTVQIAKMVYGKCHVSVHVDSEVKLQSYTCALRKVSDRDILRECSHCPKPVDVNDPHVREAANLSLEKFNKESRLGNHFRLEKITKARGERFYGPIYIVDFIIVETVCSNNTQPDAVKDCPPMDCQFAHRGFCVGSHRKIRFPVGQKGNSSVEVKCEIFEPQVSASTTVMLLLQRSRPMQRQDTSTSGISTYIRPRPRPPPPASPVP